MIFLPYTLQFPKIHFKAIYYLFVTSTVFTINHFFEIFFVSANSPLNKNSKIPRNHTRSYQPAVRAG